MGLIIKWDDVIKNFLRYIMVNGAMVDSTADESAGEDLYYYEIDESILNPLLEFLVEEAIDDWHESDTDKPLHEWIGLTEDQYKKFVEGSGLEVFKYFTQTTRD